MPAKPSHNPNDLSFPKILDNSDDTSNFSCGKKEIDEFIQKQAFSFQQQRLGITYLFHQGADLVGFATLCMGHINKHKIAAHDRLTQHVNSYPALLIGQLGVCNGQQGEGVGTYICDFCFDRAIRLSQRVGCRFLVVDALESAVKFYSKYGFTLAPKQEKEKQKLMFLDITKRQPTPGGQPTDV
ncbi:MAG: GNAT family N-acetyltransferase [Crenarchaeota archaeon]|nr:GNAT family N-acetyltransferase [Thermoproteota archaeon]